MSDTEWLYFPFHIARSIGGYDMLIIKHRVGSCSWSLSDIEYIHAEGHSRTVSAAKRQCMRAMNRHRKEAQR